MNIDYTLWPNASGTLGENKVAIPDGVTTTWPEGDTLLGNCVYQNGKLVGFVDTKALTVNSSGSTTINYDYVNIELPFAEDAMTINRGPRNKYLFIKFNDKEVEEGPVLIRFEDMDEDTKTLLYSATKVINNTLYDENDNVIGTFDTSRLATGSNFDVKNWGTTDGKEPDALWLNIDPYTEELKSCPLTVFDSDLSNLTNGAAMFAGCPLTSWNVELPNLITGYAMFYNCTNLTTFSSDLSSMTNGYGMFVDCINLTTFSSDLSSMTNGFWMFPSCKLDTASVQNIADTIKDVTSLTNGSATTDEVYKTTTIGIGNSVPNSHEITAFNTIASKGWTVYANGNEYTPTSPAAINTLDENGEETTTPIPYYAKPVPATEETASYVDENGNFYNILGAQFIYGDDLSTYGMFTCEEDAATNMGLTKIEKSQPFALKP